MSYSVIDYEAGETVFDQGDPGQDMYLVQAGEVEVRQTVGEAERQVAVLEKGDFFGEMALLESEPRNSTVRAVSAAKLVRIDRGGLEALLRRNPEVGLRMIRKLGRRLATAEEMLARAYGSVAHPENDDQTAAVGGRGHLVLKADGSDFLLPQSPELTIGRRDPANNILPDVDLTSKDPQISVSRRHARILRRGHRFLILEEAATNGTFVNGTRISAKHAIPLRSGDELLLGAVELRFVAE